jgi:hypothetical protein
VAPVLNSNTQSIGGGSTAVQTAYAPNAWILGSNLSNIQIDNLWVANANISASEGYFRDKIGGPKLSAIRGTDAAPFRGTPLLRFLHKLPKKLGLDVRLLSHGSNSTCSSGTPKFIVFWSIA